MNKIVAFGAVAALAIAAGCADKKPATADAGNLTDVQPSLPVHQQVPTQGTRDSGVMPIGLQETTPIDVGNSSGSMAPGQKYTVKRGDTLWSIAQRTYGNGNQYKKIAAANPSIKGDRVNVGQTITLP